MESEHGSDSGKHLRTEKEHGNDSGKDLWMETEYGNVSGKKLRMKNEHWSEHLRMHSEATSNDGDPRFEDQLLSVPYSLSASSSSSSSDSLLEHSSDEKDALDNSSTKSDPDDPPMSPGQESILSPDIVSGQAADWSMMTASPRYGTGIASLENLSETPELMKSPPIQTMGLPAGYDPNRIPSSIFGSKPTTPMEWSVTSNESLFSIHMGNNSFSRDHAIIFGKSGELIRPEEWNIPPSNLNSVTEAKSNELNNFSSNLPTVVESPTDDTKSDSMGEEDFRMANETLKVVGKDTAEKKMHPAEEVFHISDSGGMPHAEGVRTPPRHSHESGNSASSFAFPVLISEGSSVKTEKLQSQSQPQSQPQTLELPQTPGANPKAAETSWFSCFCCCIRCCC